MARRAVLIGLVALATGGQAQVPDVVVRADAKLVYVNEHEGRPVVRWVDPLGRHSWAGLALRLEPGLRALVAQRIQRIPGDADVDPMESYYVENPGSWRIGKQPLPFGAETVFRDAVLGVRLDTHLAIGDLPATIVLCDEGVKKSRGVVVRVDAGLLRLSAASGDHFAQSASSLGLFRDIGDAPPPGSGYRTAVGLDFKQRAGEWLLIGEVVVFRDGHTGSDPDRLVWDLALSTNPGAPLGLRAGYTYDSAVLGGRVRIEASVPIAKSLSLEPMLRLRDGTFHDFSVGLRLRL